MVWDKTLPSGTSLIQDSDDYIRANWEAIESGSVPFGGSGAQGDILYQSGSATWMHLPPGTSGQFLETGGPDANPAWVNHKNLASGVHGVGANTLEHTGNKGAANGYASLGANSKVPDINSQVPSTFKTLEKISEITLTEDGTLIDFTGLDGNVDKRYLLKILLLNGASDNNVMLQFNNDETATNYINQRLRATITTVSALKESNSRIAFIVSSDIGFLNIEILPVSVTMWENATGYPTSSCNNSMAGILLEIRSHRWMMDANITSIQIRSSYANGFLVGTRAILYRLP